MFVFNPFAETILVVSVFNPLLYTILVVIVSNVGWVGTKWKPTIFQRYGAVSLLPTLRLISERRVGRNEVETHHFPTV